MRRNLAPKLTKTLILYLTVNLAVNLKDTLAISVTLNLNQNETLTIPNLTLNLSVALDMNMTVILKSSLYKEYFFVEVDWDEAKI